MDLISGFLVLKKGYVFQNIVKFVILKDQFKVVFLQEIQLKNKRMTYIGCLWHMKEDNRTQIKCQKLVFPFKNEIVGTMSYIY